MTRFFCHKSNNYNNQVQLFINMDKEALLKFTAKAHRNTYAALKELQKKFKCEVPVLEGHKDYDFVEGDFRYHDSYTGSAWAPGREVVFFKGEPVWVMAYQGRTPEGLDKDFVEESFEFLKKALMALTDEVPFRGLDGFSEGDYRYEFKFEGDYQYFVGKEIVFYKEKEVFSQDVMGSLVK
ncbi:DUF5680 domain-containing protein [Nanoarchaeota archaeon]